MSIEPDTADQQGPLEVKPASRTVRVLTSWKLWTTLLVLGLLGIGVPLTLPIVHRLRVLEFFDENSDITGYELYREHEDWPEKYGEWTNAMRPVQSVWSWHATDEIVHYVCELREVRSLQLQESTSQPITSRGLASLRGLDQLRELRLFGKGFTEDSIAGLLQSQPPLNEVVLIETGAGRESLMAMSRIPSITRVVIVAESFRDESFRDLAPLPNLYSVTVAGAGDECLKWLASCPLVGQINLMFASVTDEGLHHLSACRNLQSLSIRQGAITDAGLRHLAAAPALEELTVIECPGITSEGISQFPEMPNLRVLHIPAEVFTTASVARLMQLPKLSHLKIEGRLIDDELYAQLTAEWSVYVEGMLLTSEQIWKMVRRSSLSGW